MSPQILIVGITGPIASGKGKVAELFKKKGFTHHSFSAEIRAVAKERGIKINRKNLSKLGVKLRKESPDKSILCERTLSTIKNDIVHGKKRFVVEGIRDIDEISMFRAEEKKNKKLRFILIGVDAPQKKRYRWLKARGRHGDPKTYPEFKKIDDAEWKGTGGQEVGKCMKKANIIIKNIGTADQLKKKADEIIKKRIHREDF
jgi:dephospho-CoA kinase